MNRWAGYVVRLNKSLKRLESSRYKSYYLSNKWSKEPFDVGYPETSSQIQIDALEIRYKLFPPKTHTEYDYFVEDVDRQFSIDEWNQLDSDQIYKYQKMADDNKPQYVHPKPEFVTGFELFKTELQLHSKAKRFWSMLSDKRKELFNDNMMVRRLYEERIRIWEGYEIVEYLKRYLTDYTNNPYPLLGLYPWEIIKDKLRVKGSIHEFEMDYYDTLIKEAFSRNSQRKALQIFYTDLQYEYPQESFHYAKVETLFNELPTYRKEYYAEKEHKRIEHAKKTRTNPYKISTPYLEFFVSFSKHYTPSQEELNLLNGTVLGNNMRKLATIKAAGRKWKTLPEQEKFKYYTNDEVSSNTRLYKEKILDWKVEMVMDYIYTVGGVVGLKKAYNWRKDMVEKTNGFTYLNRSYVKSLTYISKGNVVITSN